jgi:hypothetical protein
MFLYLLAVIPCDWITKREVLKCIVETRAQNPGSVRQSCQKAVSTDIGQVNNDYHCQIYWFRNFSFEFLLRFSY